MDDFTLTPEYKRWRARQERKRKRQLERDEVKKKAEQLRDLGWTLGEIGAELGVTRQRAYQILTD